MTLHHEGNLSASSLQQQQQQQKKEQHPQQFVNPQSQQARKREFPYHDAHT
jgi:hypothetical protein